MPQTYTIQTGTLPTPFCQDTWQEVLAGFNAVSTVTLPDNPGTVIGPGPVPTEQRNLLWIETDANGHPKGAFVWSIASGSWEQVPSIPYYFEDGSTDTSLTDDLVTISTDKNVPNHAALIGRLFLVKIKRTNPGPVTFQVDATAAKPLKKGHNQELAAGELKAGHLALIAYENTQDAYQLITTLAATVGANEFVKSDIVLPPPRVGSSGGGSTAPIAHGLGAVPAFVHASLRCEIPEHGYIKDDTIDLSQTFMTTSGDDQIVPLMVSWDASDIRVTRVAQEGSAIQILAYPAGAYVDLTDGNWRIKVYARKYP